MEEVCIQTFGLLLRGLSYNSFAYFRDALNMPARAHNFLSISCSLSAYPKNRPGFFFLANLVPNVRELKCPWEIRPVQHKLTA